MSYICINIAQNVLSRLQYLYLSSIYLRYRYVWYISTILLCVHISWYANTFVITLPYLWWTTYLPREICSPAVAHSKHATRATLVCPGKCKFQHMLKSILRSISPAGGGVNPMNFKTCSNTKTRFFRDYLKKKWRQSFGLKSLYLLATLIAKLWAIVLSRLLFMVLCLRVLQTRWKHCFFDARYFSLNYKLTALVLSQKKKAGPIASKIVVPKREISNFGGYHGKRILCWSL